jgi:regulator of cell morphogenesis and NO signaling
MSMPYTENSLVRDIVNERPKASDVFKRYRIDFCCGGNRPLGEAAAERNANMETLLAELADVYEKGKNETIDVEFWTNSSSEDLINHIQEKYHRGLEEELPALSPYVTKVARVHGDNHPELIRVNELFQELKKELLEHTGKEDTKVFPMLLKLDQAEGEERQAMVNEILELEKEHDAAGAILSEIRDITSDFALPADACGTYTLVYKRLEALEGDTFMHVHLENNILFPRFLEK